MVRSPVDICFGTSPSQAPKSRPLENAAPLPIAATVALEMIGPMPGTVISSDHRGGAPRAPPGMPGPAAELLPARRGTSEALAWGRHVPAPTAGAGLPGVILACG